MPLPVRFQPFFQPDALLVIQGYKILDLSEQPVVEVIVSQAQDAATDQRQRQKGWQESVENGSQCSQ